VIAGRIVSGKERLIGDEKKVSRKGWGGPGWFDPPGKPNQSMPPRLVPGKKGLSPRQQRKKKKSRTERSHFRKRKRKILGLIGGKTSKVQWVTLQYNPSNRGVYQTECTGGEPADRAKCRDKRKKQPTGGGGGEIRGWKSIYHNQPLALIPRK